MHINRDVLQFKTIPLLTIGPAESWTFFPLQNDFIQQRTSLVPG